MNKKFVLVLAAVLVLFAFGIASAGQIDGLQSNSGPALPATLDNYVNPGGLGDALIYNYFNARNNMVTYFSVVNSTENFGARVRIRFYEGPDVVSKVKCPGEHRGSNEVLDFDICLSEADMWSGYIRQGDGSAEEGNGAVLCSSDDDTHIVAVDGDTTGRIFGAACVPFRFGRANPESNITASDTLEGYFVIIGEQQQTGSFCGDIGTDVRNVLTGNVRMIDDTNNFAYNATAIADFAAIDITGQIFGNYPSLRDGQDGLPGLNYILTKSDLISVYDVRNFIATEQTEYVLTAPTKNLSQVCGGRDLFDNDFARFKIWDDAENTPEGGVCEFSPCNPQTVRNRLPYEINIIRMDGSALGVPAPLLTTVLGQNILTNYPAVGFFSDFGWFTINLGLTPSNPDETPSHFTKFGGVRTNGWPILGLTFMDEGAFPMQYKTYFP